MHKWKNRLSGLTAIFLFLALILPCVPSAKAASMKDITIQTQGDSINTYAYILSSPAVNCRSFQLDVNIDMKGNAKCRNWDVWIGNGNIYSKAGTLYLPGGTGSTTAVIQLKIAKTFDSITLTPTARGSYSWTMSISLSDIQEDTTISATPGPRIMSGYWDEVTVKDGSKSTKVNGFVLASPAKDCISFNVAIEIAMKGKARCKDWTVWVRSGDTFHEVGSLYLENGQGYISGTMYPREYGDFDAVAVIPMVPGSYTYTIDMEISNIVDLETASRSSDPLPGEYETIKLRTSKKSYTVPAYLLAYSVKNCTSFDLEVDVNVKRNVRCKKWDVWVLRGSGYSKVDTIELPDGTGYGFKTITFDEPRAFDGIALVPSTYGGYSWDLYVEITNVK